MSNTDTPVENETTVSANEQIHAEFMEVVQTLSTFKTTITMLSGQIKTLERNVKKILNVWRRKVRKTKTREIARHLVLRYQLRFLRIL